MCVEPLAQTQPQFFAQARQQQADRVHATPMTGGQGFAGILLPIKTGQQIEVELIQTRQAIAQRNAHQTLAFGVVFIEIFLDRLVNEVE